MNKYVEFKEKVDKWLSSDRTNIDAGATLLLQLNRNKILYNNIVAKSNVGKLVYELTKQSEILGERSKVTDFISLTNEQLAELEEKKKRLEREVLPRVYSDKKNEKGQRLDHDILTDEAKKAFDENKDLYPKLRSLHEKLKLMAKDRPCDRYPFIKQLTEYADKISANWRLYDAAVAVPPPVDQDPPTVPNVDPVIPPVVSPIVEPVVTTITPQRISSNRKYLSENKKKVASIVDVDIKSLLIDKMQIRLNELIASGLSVDAKQLTELAEIGLTIPEGIVEAPGGGE